MTPEDSHECFDLWPKPKSQWDTVRSLQPVYVREECPNGCDSPEKLKQVGAKIRSQLVNSALMMRMQVAFAMIKMLWEFK